MFIPIDEIHYSSFALLCALACFEGRPRRATIGLARIHEYSRPVAGAWARGTDSSLVNDLLAPKFFTGVEARLHNATMQLALNIAFKEIPANPAQLKMGNRIISGDKWSGAL